MKTVTAALLALSVAVSVAVAPAEAEARTRRTQLEMIVGAPAGLLTTNELAMIFLKAHHDSGNERRAIIYRPAAERARLEPVFDAAFGVWSDVRVVWR